MVWQLFNTGTRSIRVLNLTVHLVWLLLTIAHITNVVVIDLPDTFEPRMNMLVWLLLANVLLTMVSLTAEGRRRTLTKYVSLLLGSLIELIIAYKYSTAYPPLTPMVIVSSVLALWFIGAALYVKRECKESINASSAVHR